MITWVPRPHVIIFPRQHKHCIPLKHCNFSVFTIFIYLKKDIPFYLFIVIFNVKWNIHKMDLFLFSLTFYS